MAPQWILSERQGAKRGYPKRCEHWFGIEIAQTIGISELAVGAERWACGHQVHVRLRGHQVLRGSGGGEESISPPFFRHRQATTVEDDWIGHRAGRSVTVSAIGRGICHGGFPWAHARRANGKQLYESGRKRLSLLPKVRPEPARGDARDHGAIVIADVKKGESEGKQLVRPILGVCNATTDRMLSGLAACRLHCDKSCRGSSVVDCACAIRGGGDHLPDLGSAVCLIRHRCPPPGRLILRY